MTRMLTIAGGMLLSGCTIQVDFTAIAEPGGEVNIVGNTISTDIIPPSVSGTIGEVLPAVFGP